jgi:hypothetical protein
LAGKLSDTEETEIRWIEARERKLADAMSGVSSFMNHAAHQKTDRSVSGAFSTKRFSANDQCDIGTAIRRAGGTVDYRKSIGANDKAIKASMFGLDYLLLKPVE